MSAKGASGAEWQSSTRTRRRARQAGHVDASIVAVDRFVEATRDSGYRGTGAAVAEFVDNALEAGATKIAVDVRRDSPSAPIAVSVADNGVGMSPAVLRRALRFGGSTRFNSRTGLGRYGMGLPNAAVSQARRVDVYSWRSPTRVWRTHLDIDEVVEGGLSEIPRPTPSSFPGGVPKFHSGTLVVLTKCDRLDAATVPALIRRLRAELGRRFRYYIWSGRDIRLNSERVSPIDPLFLRREERPKATIFGEVLEYSIRSDPDDRTSPVGRVEVTFAELSVAEGIHLSNRDKHHLGITGGGGVSIVRAGREVERGWFLMGAKRKENYDDWWRAEVRFDPVLDEAFGITHTKQQVNPRDYLKEILGPDLEVIARALNSRVREAHLNAKKQLAFLPAEQIAGRNDRRLPPVHVDAFKHAGRQTASRRGRDQRGPLVYRLLEEESRSGSLYSCHLDASGLTVLLNEHHPFIREVLSPLAEEESPLLGSIRTRLQLLLLAAARAELTLPAQRRKQVESFRRVWSDILAAFMADAALAKR